VPDLRRARRGGGLVAGPAGIPGRIAGRQSASPIYSWPRCGTSTAATTPMHQVAGKWVRVDRFRNLGNVIDRTGDHEPSALINLSGDDGP
jgi:hypothetical protein